MAKKPPNTRATIILKSLYVIYSGKFTALEDKPHVMSINLHGAEDPETLHPDLPEVRLTDWLPLLLNIYILTSHGFQPTGYC